MTKRRTKQTKEIPNTLRRLARNLFPTDTERERFLTSVWSPAAYTPAIVWIDDRAEAMPFPTERPFAWQPEFVDRVSIAHRPGLQPLHQGGSYYCLGCSSVFTASMLLDIELPAPVVLDLCAAPGGKSIFAWRALAPRRLVSNEVIGKRLGPLIANLERCRVPGLVMSGDSLMFAEQAAGSADLVIVDAPCSGQSLIASGKSSPGCFHPSTINLNANRQRRILANAARVVAPHGWLAYITCTYAVKENEGNVRWFLKTFEDFQATPVPRLQRFQSHLTEQPCYRLWPFDQEHGDPIGAGGFCALLKRTGAGPHTDWWSAEARLRGLHKWSLRSCQER